jgi:hypothetical protein
METIAAEVEAERETTESGRDEPLAAGASRQRIDGQPNSLRQFGGDEEEAVSIDGELNILRQFYGACIDATRRSKPAHERAAAVRALRRELKAAVLAVTTRHRNEQAAHREAARRVHTPRYPKSFN